MKNLTGMSSATTNCSERKGNKQREHEEQREINNRTECEPPVNHPPITL